MKLFVYGSLKSGGWAHYFIEHDVENGREAFVFGKLRDNGTYPALDIDNIDSEDNRVYGVLYDIGFDVDQDELIKNLDRFECYPELFDRIDNMPIFLMKAGGCEEAVCYVAKDKWLFDLPIIGSGVWEV